MSLITDDTITLPEPVAIPGLVLRHFRGPADYPGLAAATNATHTADGEDWFMTVQDVENYFAHMVNCDPARDLVIAEVDGAIIGYVRVEWRAQADGLYRYYIDMQLGPQYRGHGLRRAMLHWAETRIREVAAGHPTGAPKVFSMSAAPKADSLSALLESEGYRAARYYNVMVRDLTAPLPDFAMPPGLELRPVRPEHYRDIWDASDEAFRDHWGYSPRPESYFDMWRNDPIAFTPELWQVAWDVATDEIAGEIQTFIDREENERLGRKRGYTETIGVRRPYRRRGLARAMIVESLRTLKTQGMTESALHVDAENISGATRLYEACGFVVEKRTTAYRKPLDEGTG